MAKKDKKSGANVNEIFDKIEGVKKVESVATEITTETIDIKKSKKNIEEKKASKVNDGKCCRCTYRNCEKICNNPKSKKHNKYVARKFGCSHFKYDE